MSFGIFFKLSRAALQRTWGDLGSGVWFALTRRSLLQLENQKIYLKNWRPNLLVFTGQPYNREHLVEVSRWLGTARGLSTFLQIIPGDVDGTLRKGLTRTAKKYLNAYVRSSGLDVFSQGIAVKDYKNSIPVIVQAHGIGRLEANAVLMGLSGSKEGLEDQLELAKTLYHLKRSTLLLKFDRERGWGKKRRIHVWWGGQGGNAELMLLLAHLIAEHPQWKGSSIHILRIVSGSAGAERVKEHLSTLLREVRVKAQPEVIVHTDKTIPILEVIREKSEHADLTFLGMVLPEEGKFDAEAAERLLALTQAVGSAILVRSVVDSSILSTG